LGGSLFFGSRNRSRPSDQPFDQRKSLDLLLPSSPFPLIRASTSPVSPSPDSSFKAIHQIRDGSMAWEVAELILACLLKWSRPPAFAPCLTCVPRRAPIGVLEDGDKGRNFGLRCKTGPSDWMRESMRVVRSSSLMVRFLGVVSSSLAHEQISTVGSGPLNNVHRQICFLRLPSFPLSSGFGLRKSEGMISVSCYGLSDP